MFSTSLCSQHSDAPSSTSNTRCYARSRTFSKFFKISLVNRPLRGLQGIRNWQHFASSARFCARSAFEVYPATSTVLPARPPASAPASQLAGQLVSRPAGRPAGRPRARGGPFLGGGRKAGLPAAAAVPPSSLQPLSRRRVPLPIRRPLRRSAAACGAGSGRPSRPRSRGGGRGEGWDLKSEGARHFPSLRRRRAGSQRPSRSDSMKREGGGAAGRAR